MKVLKIDRTEKKVYLIICSLKKLRLLIVFYRWMGMEELKKIKVIQSES